MFIFFFGKQKNINNSNIPFSKSIIPWALWSLHKLRIQLVFQNKVFLFNFDTCVYKSQAYQLIGSKWVPQKIKKVSPPYLLNGVIHLPSSCPHRGDSASQHTYSWTVWSQGGHSSSLVPGQDSEASSSNLSYFSNSEIILEQKNHIPRVAFIM